MKVALVHDYLKEYGGAERVLEALHELYPEADVFTSLYLPSYLGPHKKRFENWKIHTSFLQYIPFKQKLISPFRILSPLAFRSFDFSQYDVVIVSATGAYFPNSIRIKNHESRITNEKNDKNHSPLAIRHKPVHICYCHTPPRYLYGYATAREWKKHVVFKAIGELMNHFLRMVDFASSKNVDYYIANSEEVRRRIEKFYRRDARVIYPPIEIQNHESRITNQEKEDYFLAGGRLARPKHIDLIVKACMELDVPLKVFGKSFAGYGEELEQMANGKWQIVNGEKKPLIDFVGEVTDEEKWELMQNAKAYINASEDEDFGITPVEAMALGTPVIAYRSGGVRETVVDGKTGIFFDELTVDSLRKAITDFNTVKHISREACIKQAEKFSKEQFQTRIKKFTEETLRK